MRSILRRATSLDSNKARGAQGRAVDFHPLLHRTKSAGYSGDFAPPEEQPGAKIAAIAQQQHMQQAGAVLVAEGLAAGGSSGGDVQPQGVQSMEGVECAPCDTAVPMEE